MGRPKKETEEITAVAKETAEDKNARLEKELEELKAQMALLLKANAKSDIAVPTKKEKEKEKNIPFVNLTNGKVCLKGTKQWELIGQFTKKNFLEREARVIVSNMPNAIADGIVYIADADFIEENDLSAVYANLLTDKQLKELLKHDSSYVVEAYKSTSDAQKDIIVGMLTDMMLAGKKVDYNVLVEIGNLCGRDLVGIEIKDDNA